ncbi:hypothetical protein [Aurantiacibacter rhizosphaerae]|uniref:Uncharacterized protein n=1 Tax=Aurantiacibacter rhizosphaerae TaxID=2691582 RepID=A0A844X987_9SPHN|nr:hypothetical protein [Aurantiacibacter rhizosphaerae]MWV26383.1 hypothetical protein [Aurantiacibacter rhizosphaerae]
MVDGLLFTAMAAAAAGIGLLRWSWSLDRRSAIANLAAWAMLLTACIIGGAAAGAWGIAAVSLVAMGVAGVLLGWAAATSPAGPTKSKDRAENRRAHILPESGGPLGMGRRIVTFVLVVLAGFAASIALAIALRAIATAIDWAEADANAVALLAVPVVWGILATVLLMLGTRRQQIIALLAASLPLVPALLISG